MRKTIITLVVTVAGLVPVASMGDGMPPGSGAATEKRPATRGADAQKVTQADLQPDAPDADAVRKQLGLIERLDAMKN